MREKIISLQNINIKKIIKMKKANKRKDDFLIEGAKELSLAIISDIKIKEIYYCPEFNFDKKILKQFNQDILIEVSKIVFQKISLREHPDGILAIAENQNFSLAKINLQDISSIIALEKVEKPGNIGAIARTIDAVGKTLLILINPQTDFFNPNVIRTSRGSIFNISKALCTKEEFLDWIKNNNLKTFATTASTNKNYTELKYENKNVFLFGTEHEGLSNDLLNIANEKIKIPMNGKIDSLNVSVSSAIILYEVLRQKNKQL